MGEEKRCSFRGTVYSNFKMFVKILISRVTATRAQRWDESDHKQLAIRKHSANTGILVIKPNRSLSKKRTISVRGESRRARKCAPLYVARPRTEFSLAHAKIFPPAIE
jgi:hypothetical protein